MGGDKPWFRSKKIFVFLSVVATYFLTIALSAVIEIPPEVISILSGGVLSAGTTVAAVQGMQDRERERKN